MALSGLLARLNCREYKNWMKAGQCLLMLHGPLQRYIEREMRAFHQQLASQVTAPRHWRRCQCKATGKQFQPSCPVCKQWKELLLAHHNQKNGDIHWGNSDPSLWPTHYLEVAKVYMPRGQTKEKGLKQCDVAALLNLINFCDYFQVPNISRVRAMIRCRNELMHSYDMTVSSSWLEDFGQKMHDLLTDLTFVPGLVLEGEKIQEILLSDWNIEDLGMSEVDIPIVQAQSWVKTDLSFNLSPYEVEIQLIQELIQELYLDIEEHNSLTEEDQDKVLKIRNFLAQNKDLHFFFRRDLEILGILQKNYAPVNTEGWTRRHRFAVFSVVVLTAVVTAFLLR